MTVELSTLGEVIKETYEGNANTNAYTDDEKSKLAGIESEATKNSPDAYILNRQNHTGVQSSATIIDLPDVLANKVDVVEGKGLSDANFTQAEKDKLAQLEDGHFKGVFVGLQSLEDTHPTGEPGDYAVVDDGVDLVWYQWDTSAWSVRQGESADVTPAQVKTYYESNPDTNAFTDDEKSGLANLLASNRFTFRRRGTWNAETNTPELLNGSGVNGDFYVVTVPGTRDFGVGPFNFRVQDWVIYAGGVWQRLTVADQLLDWDDIQNKPAAVEPRGMIGPSIASCLVHLTANQLTSNEAYWGINWDAAIYDHFGIWSGATLFTMPEWATHARVSATVQWASANASWRALGCQVNGVEPIGSGFVRGLSAAGTAPQFNFQSAIIPVEPGDNIRIMSYQFSGSSLNLTAGSRGQNCWAQIELFESI